MATKKLQILDSIIVTDDTLTQSNVPADAKAVGDAIAANQANNVGIASVEQTTKSTEDDGDNIITVELTDGTTSAFTVQNGSKGSDGYSPVRGTDYWTESDIAEIKSYVDEAILGGTW